MSGHGFGRILLCIMFIVALQFGLDNQMSTARTLLFIQPPLASLRGHFCVRCQPPANVFSLVQWEDNPFSQNGKDVPLTVDLSSFTGISSSSVREEAQIGIRDSEGTSGVQVGDGAVGAFINSKDLPNGSPQNKFIIAPGIEFDPQPEVFRGGSGRIHVSFDLQVPVASSKMKTFSSAYVVSDLMFQNADTKQTAYINAIVFKVGVPPPNDNTFFDIPTATPVAIGSFSAASHFFDVDKESFSYHQAPWSGWRHFSYSIGYENLKSAMDAVNRRSSLERTNNEMFQWRLKHWHLNAEILFSEGDSELGWSLRNTKITYSP